MAANTARSCYHTLRSSVVVFKSVLEGRHGMYVCAAGLSWSALGVPCPKAT
jgi:hypothetical protein